MAERKLIHRPDEQRRALEEGLKQTTQKTRVTSSSLKKARTRVKSIPIDHDEKLRVKKENVQEEIMKLHEENEEIVECISEISENIGLLYTNDWEKMLPLENALVELKERCKTLEENYMKLSRKIEKLEEMYMKIHLAQATWLFERYVARFVLPETIKVGRFGAYKQMIKHLENDTTVKDTWLRVQSNGTVKWLGDHWAAIEDLREARNHEAHPKVDFEQAIKEIDKTVPQHEKECRDIIRIVATVNSIMQVGILACKLKEIKMKASEDSAQNEDESSLWKNLINDIEWSCKHNQALDEMIKLKREIEDLQDVDLEEAKIHLVGYVPKELEKECCVIIDILKKL